MTNLQQFCSTDLFRPYLARPFTRNGFTWATNGHVIVRVAERADALPIEEDVNTEKVLDGIDAVTFYKPSFKLPEGTDKNAAVCESCEGRGHLHDCPNCECECDECNATGRITPRYSTKIGSRFYSLEYMRMILSLPNIELSIVGDEEPKFSIMFFRFDGGVGAVMNRDAPLKHHVEIEVAQ